MCGIVFSGNAKHPALPQLVEAVASRGPDCAHTLIHDKLACHASVLHLRGDQIARQPFENDRGILVYNGQVFDGLDVMIDQNDGERLFAALTKFDPLTVLREVEGPYALAYFDKSTRNLFYARDPVGRRSLLQCRDGDDFLLSSCVPASQQSASWTEVSCDAVFQLDLNTSHFSQHSRKHYSNATGATQQRFPFDRLNDRVPTEYNRLHPCTDDLQSSTTYAGVVAGLRAELTSSISKRVLDIPRLNGPPAPHARVAILFSGGLDCSVLALLASGLLPLSEPIDLLNVAFENPRKGANIPHSTNGIISNFQTPDRQTGLQTLQELRRLQPDRQWNFVQVNVLYAEFLQHRARIVELMWPNDTVMDLSIAQALYFAARGIGILADTDQSYTSTARVLLSGLGADELLGGYSRHKKAFGVKEDWSALVAELQMDLDRIGSRNLGRDDRVISNLGKEVRYPYLAGHIIKHIASLPVHLKMDFRLGNGIGDKRLLRALARSLGLSQAAGLHKRAIQFGARSAKMEIGSSNLKGDAVVN